MKTLRTIMIIGCLAVAGISYAQTTPVPQQPVPQTNPVPTTPETDKKSEFNAPQSPVRPAQIPSEDTLIKGQRSSGVLIQDSLVPSSDKKKDRAERRKAKKGSGEMDDSTSTNKKDEAPVKP
jgi:hypothetical protein